MQRGALLVICLLASFVAGDEMPLSPTEEKLDYLARTVDKALKFFKKQQEAEKELIKMLESAEDALKADGDPTKKQNAGTDYSDDPIQSGGLNNGASGGLMEKFSKFKPTRTKDGSLHMKLAQKPGEEAVYKFKVDDLRQLAKTAHQEDSPPPRKQGFLRTGAGSIKSEAVGQGHTIFQQTLLPNYKEVEYPISNDYGLYGGNQAKNPPSYSDYSQNGREVAYDDNYPGSDYSDSVQNNNEASGSLLEKYSKFKPTRTKDGVLHMKLAQKPGEETVYKFKVNELRELAKTAHQVNARRR